MTVEFWIGQLLDTTHEQKVIDQLIEEINIKLGDKGDFFFILINYFLDGRRERTKVLSGSYRPHLERKE